MTDDSTPDDQQKPSAHTSTASSEHRCVLVCRDGCREARVILFVVAEVFEKTEQTVPSYLALQYTN